LPFTTGRVCTGEAPNNYTVSQGTRLGWAEDITSTADPDGTGGVGGATTTCFRGAVTL
jgi:hypothetical protein